MAVTMGCNEGKWYGRAVLDQRVEIFDMLSESLRLGPILHRLCGLEAGQDNQPGVVL